MELVRQKGDSGEVDGRASIRRAGVPNKRPTVRPHFLNVDPSRGRINTASRDGPSSDSVVGDTRTARRRRV